jgi:hypothetical protein
MGLTGLIRPVSPIQDAGGATQSREGQKTSRLYFHARFVV